MWVRLMPVNNKSITHWFDKSSFSNNSYQQNNSKMHMLDCQNKSPSHYLLSAHSMQGWREAWGN